MALQDNRRQPVKIIILNINWDGGVMARPLTMFLTQDRVMQRP